MYYDYIFYEDETSSHGFTIEIDKDDIVNMKTLDGFGDFSIMNNKWDLKHLREFLENNLHQVKEEHISLIYTNKELFEELIEILKENEGCQNEI